MQVTGHNALTKLKALIGPKDPAKGNEYTTLQAEKDTLRSFYGVDRLDNAFFVSETIHEAQIEDTMLFGQGNNIDPAQAWQVSSIKNKGSKTLGNNENTPIHQILLQNQVELALIVISPTLVMNNDFVFVMDEFYRTKFQICAFKKKAIDKTNLQALFGDLAPQVHSLDLLDVEFRRGDSVLLVVEGAKAVEEIQELVGKFGIKVGSDFEKKKRKTTQGYQFINNNLKSEANCLIREYGSYIFTFPNAERNREKIA